MLRLIAASVAGVLLSVVLLKSSSPMAANNAEVSSIEDIMKKLNSKKRGIHPALDPMLKADSVPWSAVSKMTKEYAELAADLGKNKPEKGGAATWTSLCRTYAADAKALNTAAAKKDKAAALNAYGKLSKSCQACHDEHR